MVTIRWKIPYDCRRCGRSWSHAVWWDRVADDSLGDGVAFFSVERTLVDTDPGPALISLSHVRSEALDDVGPTVVIGVAQGDDKTARVRRALIIAAAPGVDVHVAVRADDDVSGVPDRVRE